MTRITWNDINSRFYEDGVDRGVLYPISGPGVAWSGLVSIDENVSGGEQTPLYYDGTKYLDVIGSEDFQATLSAYAAPAEFGVCDGTVSIANGLYATQQPRRTFNLCYRTLIGSDTKKTRYGYKLHLVYNATAAPSGRSSKTLTDSPAPETRSWTIDTVPADRGTLLIKPTAHLIIDSTKSNPDAMVAIENLLYGSASLTPQMLSQSAFATLLSS